MARRFYIKQNLNVGDILKFESEDYNHIVNVLRFRLGENLIVCNGENFDYICQLIEINKKDCKFKIIDKIENNVEAKSKLDVFQALIKGEKFELLAQKLTELGVNKLVPFTSAFTTVKENTTRLNRLEKISIESVKQCGRAKPIEINEIISFDEMINKLKQYDIVIFAYENSKNNFDFSNLAKFHGENVALIIGSEGGFSEQEEKFLLNLPNIYEITLGKRILRAETATIALTSVVMCALKEWCV